MNPIPPVHIHPHYHDNASGWFLAALIGWFLLTYVLQLGKGTVLGAFIQNVIFWVVMTDAIAIMAGIALGSPRPPGLGVYRLVKHPRPRKPVRDWLLLRIRMSIRRWRRHRKSSSALR